MDDSRCGLLFKQIDSALQKRANAQLAEQGLTLSQMIALEALYEQPNHQANFKQLERALKVSQPTTVGIISRLKEKGLVDSFISADDQRVKIAVLTELGMDACCSAKKRMASEEEVVLSGFSAKEQKEFQAMLARVLHNITN